MSEKISCEEVLAEIERYVDRELDTRRAVHLAEHLGECGACFDRAEFRRKLKEIVRVKCGPGETPEHLVWRIKEAINRESGSES